MGDAACPEVGPPKPPEVPLSCAQCRGIAQEFDPRLAHWELKRYRRRGPSATTRRLLGAIRGAGVRGASFLDIGGGIGALQHGLLEAGAMRGTAVDASPAYLGVAREEARARGHDHLLEHLEGDFVTLAPEVEPADVVTLDRVLCCYDDMPALVDASASRARRLYGLVIPREHLVMRAAFGAINAAQWLRRRPFQVFLHGTERIEARVRHHGFTRAYLGLTPLWQIHLYIREAGSATGH